MRSSVEVKRNRIWVKNILRSLFAIHLTKVRISFKLAVAVQITESLAP